MSEPTIEQLVKVRNKIDTARKAATKEYETADAALKGKIEQIDIALLAALDKAGLKSAKTEHGTVYKQVETLPRAEDWKVFFEWVQEDLDRFEFLHKRISTNAINDYMEANLDENDLPTLPPGVSVTRRFVARVRKN